MSSEPIFVRKIGTSNQVTAFAAIDEQSNDSLVELPTDRDIKIVATVPRNLKFHRKFFALLSTILNYMDERTKLQHNIFSTTELLQRLKLDLGLYTLYVMGPGSKIPEGTPVFIPDSISFGKMDEAKFNKMYKATIGIAIGKYTTNQTEESMMRAVDAVLRFE